MLELKNIAYIDLQKTGSTTIGSVLEDFTGETRLHKTVHGRVPGSFERGKLAFVSIREPLMLCASLFCFGAAEKRGRLYYRLMKDGYSGLYEPNIKGFERWLDFVTDPKRASALGKHFGRYQVHNDIGLLSYRLLDMSVRSSQKALKALGPGKQNVGRLLKQERVYNDYVRTESLATDLFALLKRYQERLTFAQPLTTAEDMIARVPNKNASSKIDGVNAHSVSRELRERVFDREWLIYREFGYDNNPMGLPSDQNPRFQLEP